MRTFVFCCLVAVSLPYRHMELPSSVANSRLLPGWNGEGLLLYDREVDIASGLVSQAAVQVVHTLPGRGRAATD